MLRPGSALSAVVLLGCSPRTGGTGEAIEILPAEAVVETAGAPVAVLFRARTRSGADVTRSASWSLEHGLLGRIADGLFTTLPDLDRGGTVRVTCDHDGHTATAMVRVRFLAPDLFAGGATDETAAAFDGPPGGAAPQIVYPLPGVLLARNIHQMRIAWQSEAGHRHFRFTFDAPTYQQRLYVGARACSDVQCSYRVPDEDWARLAHSAAGGSVQVTLSASAGPGQPVGRAGAIQLHFSPEDVRGGLYYFATSRYGLYRLPFGGQRAVPFLLGKGPDDITVDRCIGCHAVSRDGRKVAAVWAGGDGYAGIVDGADPGRFLLRPIPPRAGESSPTPGQMWNFASFSPGGEEIIGVWKGQLALRSGDNGNLIARVPAAALGGGRAAMPEWSPDGKWIVFVRVAGPDGRLGSDISRRDPNTGQLLIEAGDWILANAGDIALLPYDNGRFGDAITLVPRTPDGEYHFYPSFSPDSRWIVFNSVRKADCFSPTAERNGVEVGGRCMTYDQRGARLRLVRAVPGATPIELAAATHLPGRTTAWPKFAPFQQAGGRLVFITFSAKFDYGWVVQQDQIRMATGLERPQLWMSALDLDRAERGIDPSHAPFWLPFQDPGTNNHAVIWTQDIACRRASDCGDEFDCTQGVCVPKLG